VVVDAHGSGNGRILRGAQRILAGEW
jgi:hypothetical protein